MARTSWTAIVREEGGWWVGWIAEVPGVNAQEHTREALLSTLADVLREALEMNRREALRYAEHPYEEVAVAI